MSAQIQKFGYDASKSLAGVLVSNNLKIHEKLQLGNSVVGGSLANGVVYAGLSDVINYFSGKGSKILAGNIKDIANDALFFGTLSGVARVTGADGTLFDTLNRVSPLSRENNLILVETSILTTGRFVAEYIESTPQAPDLLKKVRRPLSLVM